MFSDKTELIAVNKVKEGILQTDILRPFISENDKTPSWDGNIIMYHSAQSKKSNIKGSVPVQIKGKVVKRFGNDTISYPIEIADLENYLSDGGVLFFVVQIIDGKNTKIYCESLLPLDIKQLLATKNNATKSVKLKYLDTSKPWYIETICYNFLEHKKRQYSTIDYSRDISEFKVISSTLIMYGNRNSLFEYLLENGLYIYGHEHEGAVPIPISKVFIETMSHQMNKQIVANSKVYYRTYTVTESKVGKSITFGKSIQLYLDKPILNYQIKGTLKERLKDLEFLSDLSENNTFFIGDLEIKGLKISIENKESIKRCSRYLNDVNHLMEFFCIQSELEMDACSIDDYNRLNMLIDIILYNKKIKSEVIKSGIYHFQIGNLNIMLIAFDIDGIVCFEDYFSAIHKKYKFVLSFKEEQASIEASCYTKLLANDVIKSSNLNLEMIEESVKSYPLNEDYASFVNNLALELIKAYDINNNLLGCLSTALNLCLWLTDYDNNSSIYKLNQYQIKKRMGDLERADKVRLLELAKAFETDLKLQCAISIILENKSAFEIQFDKLPENDREQFIEWPIYYLKNVFK